MTEPNRQEDPKPSLFFTGKGIQTGDPRNRLSKKRLFIVENLRKAGRIKAIYPEDQVISTGGVPFDIALSIPRNPQEKLDYSISIKRDKGEALRQEIIKAGRDCGCILLLTEPTARGEAIAAALVDTIPELAGLWARLPLRALNREEVQNQVEFQQNLPPDRRRQPHASKAQAYWIQAVMDMTWKRKISPWVGEATRLIQALYQNNPAITPGKTPESLTRVQCAMLHTIQLRQSQRENYRPYEYWEIHTLLRGTIPGSTLKAPVSVPTITILDKKSSKLTRKIWIEKMEKNQEDCRLGIGIPQKEPGQPWRFQTEDEACLYRYHLKRFPFFTIEDIQITEQFEEPLAPHTANTILQVSTQQGWGSQKDIYEALDELYLGGLISYPRTGNPNFTEETLRNLRRFAAKIEIDLVHPTRTFPGDEDTYLEGIHPTIWDANPAAAEKYIDRATKPPRAALARRLYQEIYERAVKSQTIPNPIQNLQISVMGPLPITEVRIQHAGSSHKESPIESQMNVVLTGKIEDIDPSDPLLKLPKDGLMQTTKTYLEKGKTTSPEEMNKDQLLLLMQQNNIAKLDTLLDHVPKLVDMGLLLEEKGILNLTPSGTVIIRFLNQYLGQFIHNPYHQTITSQLREVEKGHQDGRVILNYWWTSFCDIADYLPPIPEAVADSSGKTLEEIEKLLKPKNAPIAPEQPNLMAM